MRTKQQTLLLATAVLICLTAAVGAAVSIGTFANFTEIASAAVPTPKTSAKQFLFVDTADHKLKRKLSSGSVTTIEGGGGGGLASTDIVGWSLVNYCNYSGGTCATAATNATTGMKFQALVPITVTGVNFYWPGGLGALTVRVRLYNAAGTSLGNADVSVNAAGIYTGSFTGVTIAAANTYKAYYASMWETSGVNYARTTDIRAMPGYVDATATVSIASFQANPFIYVITDDMYGVGDVVPSVNTTSQFMLAEPIYTVP